MGASRLVGVCGDVGGWSTRRLVDAVAALGFQATPFELVTCDLHLAGDGARPEVRWAGQPVRPFEAVLVKKVGDVRSRAMLARLQTLFALEARGIPVHSPPAAIATAVDRIAMTRVLAEAGIPIPRTLITRSAEAATDFVRATTSAILKPIFTSKARGMERLSATDRDGAQSAIARALAGSDEPLYLQEQVEAVGGADFGIAILGGRMIGGYRRVAPEGAWITTIAQGGRYAPLELTSEIEELALRAAAPFGLTFTGVDIVPTRAGPRVYEVSAFGGFRGLWETARVDAAALFAHHVLDGMDPQKIGSPR